VLLLDEPTNHLDLEGIEALADGLERYDGTLLFVSHDRWFVSRLATRIVELTERGLTDFGGTYEEYLVHCGDDHLDARHVVEQARKNKKLSRIERSQGQKGQTGQKGPDGQ
jgi:ATPase subunit of ABC transporter with duplicated ATPase domains